jgi:hypothetical protein
MVSALLDKKPFINSLYSNFRVKRLGKVGDACRGLFWEKLILGDLVAPEHIRMRTGKVV